MIDPQIELLRGATVLPLHGLIARGLMRLDEDGLGLPDVQRLTERGPQQHGDTDVGYRLQPRIISLVLLADGDDDITEYWMVRRELQRMLRPSSVPLHLRYTLPTSEVRQIDVAYAGGLTWGSSERTTTMHRAAVQLRAADPTFYDPAGVSVAFTIPAGGGAWTIPWAIPWGIGTSTINTTQPVATPGDWESYPRIVVQGPLTNVVIRNVTTNEKLDFTGYTVLLGDTLTIDTRYGIKSVVDAAGINRISALSDDSDLATFRVAADPDAPGGINTCQVTGTVGGGTTAVFVQFNARYIEL